jgi:hypothetical protein
LLQVIGDAQPNIFRHGAVMICTPIRMKILRAFAGLADADLTFRAWRAALQTSQASSEPLPSFRQAAPSKRAALNARQHHLGCGMDLTGRKATYQGTENDDLDADKQSCLHSY